MEIHKFAQIIPEMTPEEFKELKEDIEVNGFDSKRPIILYEEKILDGRHRYKACKELKIKPVFGYYSGDQPLSYVISANVKRRHLTKSQLACIAVEALPFFKEEAAKRKKAGVNLRAKFPEGQEGRSRDLVGEAFGVSGRYVDEAEKIKKNQPERFEKIKIGEESLYDMQKNKTAHVSQNTGEMEWFTPPEYIQAAKNVMGSIDTDPASCALANKNIKAKIYYTAKQDGLKKVWKGNVWLNPPYSQPLVDDFSQVLTEKIKSGEVKQAIVLVNNATDTKWLQRLLKICKGVCFIEKRVRFLNSKGEAVGAPLQGQVIVYIGENKEKFEKVFLSFGTILWKESK